MVFVLMVERAEMGVAEHFLLLTHTFTPYLTEPKAKFNNSHWNIKIEDGESGALFLVKSFVKTKSMHVKRKTG